MGGAMRRVVIGYDGFPCHEEDYTLGFTNENPKIYGAWQLFASPLWPARRLAPSAGSPSLRHQRRGLWQKHW